MENTITNPLKLTYSPQLFVGYKVNKPNDQTGEFVDKKIADELLKACEDAKNRLSDLMGNSNWAFSGFGSVWKEFEQLEAAIKLAKGA